MDLIMGMNSGSSFDGIDVVLAETELDADGFPKGSEIPAGRILRLAGGGCVHCARLV